MLCTRGSGDGEGIQNLDPDFKGAYDVLLSNTLIFVLSRKKVERIEKELLSVLVFSHQGTVQTTNGKRDKI